MTAPAENRSLKDCQIGVSFIMKYNRVIAPDINEYCSVSAYLQGSFDIRRRDAEQRNVL